MSGIYIKGMEMPNRCVDCPLGIWEDREVMPYCAVTDECFCVNEFIGKRSEDCPLVSVPDHGRLIDVDAPLELHLRLDKKTGKNSVDIYAPIIIPADKEDTE